MKILKLAYAISYLCVNLWQFMVSFSSMWSELNKEESGGQEKGRKDCEIPAYYKVEYRWIFQ